MTKSPIVGITVNPIEIVTCTDPTVHFASGCDLLKYYDSDGDGILSESEYATAIHDGLITHTITNAELQFVRRCYEDYGGIINNICPGCTETAPTKSLTIGVYDEDGNTITSADSGSNIVLSGEYKEDGTPISGSIVYVFQCDDITGSNPTLIDSSTTDAVGNYSITVVTPSVTDETDIYFMSSDTSPPS